MSRLRDNVAGDAALLVDDGLVAGEQHCNVGSNGVSGKSSRSEIPCTGNCGSQ